MQALYIGGKKATVGKQYTYKDGVITFLKPIVMTGTNIIKTKAGKFRVKYYAANGELLAVSEVLNSRQSANKNIKAMGKIFEMPVVNLSSSQITAYKKTAL